MRWLYGSLFVLAGLFLIIVSLTGCTVRSPAQSWDQANLKRNDAGCPTSIFVPDGTTTTLCPPRY